MFTWKKIRRKMSFYTMMAFTVLFISAAVMTGCGGSAGNSAQVGSSNTSGDKTHIIIGTEGVMKGWSEMSDDSSKDSGLQGYEIDVWKEIAKRNHWTIEWKTAEFQALWGMLDNGQLDTIAAMTSISPKRQEKYNFSVPYAYGTYVFILKDTPDFPTDLSWFKGKKVCVNAPTNPRITLEEMNKEKDLGIQIGYLDTEAVLLQAVQNGQYDATFMNKNIAYTTMGDMNGLKVFDPHYKAVENAYAFRKTPDGDHLRIKVDEALNAMMKDGTLAALSKKWLHYDVTVKN